MVARLAPESVETARLAALADRCVQCGLCLPHCPTYALDRVESESPRGRIAYMGALARGDLMPSETGDRHLDHCLGCLRCEAACPAGVAYGELLIGTRTLQAPRRTRPDAVRWRLALLAHPRLLGYLLRLYRALYPRVPARWRPLPRPPAPAAMATAEAKSPAQARLFVGCVAGPFEATTRVGLQRLLADAGLDTEIPAAQGCCGAAHAHAGDAAAAAALATHNRRALAGEAPVLCLATGCLGTLRGSLAGAAPVEDALGFLAAHAQGLRFRSAGGRTVAVHRPCTQAPARAAELRALLARIPDLRVVELPDTGCCGAAGLHAAAEPDRAARLRDPLLAALRASDATELLSANIGCRLHLSDAAKLPVRHPIDFLAEHLA